jgi:hypothetical protein
VLVGEELVVAEEVEVVRVVLTVTIAVVVAIVVEVIVVVVLLIVAISISIKIRIRNLASGPRPAPALHKSQRTGSVSIANYLFSFSSQVSLPSTASAIPSISSSYQVGQ